MTRLPRVTKKHKCPICSGVDWCGFTDDGAMAICMRIWSPKQAKNGGFIHFLDDSQKIVSYRGVKNSKKDQKPRKNISDLHEIYSAFLTKLKLNDSHREQLRARGFNNIEIDRIGFKTMPNKFESKNICRKLKKDGFLLENVPGFFTPRSETIFVDYFGAEGYLIPLKTSRQKIRALTLRRTDGGEGKYRVISSGWLPKGANAGTPPHTAGCFDKIKPENVREIIITEGAIKAELIFKFTQIVTLGLFSVTTFSDSFSEQLIKVFPNLKKCVIAFDMDKFDIEKPNHCAFVHVGRHRDRLVNLLKKQNIKVKIKTWEGGFKGYDDYLNATRNINYANAA